MTNKLADPPAEVEEVASKVFTDLKSLQADYDRADVNWQRAKEKASALKKVAEECAEAIFAYNRKLGEPLPMFETGGEKNGEDKS
jgi:hypothetical protein